MDASDRTETLAAFKEAVNMTPAELRKHLETEDSKRVGWKGDDGAGKGESVGHASGRRIVELKGKKQAELTDDDLAHMKKVIGYVHRHLKQGGPAKDKQHSDWRYSLMNWGHDPLKS